MLQSQGNGRNATPGRLPSGARSEFREEQQRCTLLGYAPGYLAQAFVIFLILVFQPFSDIALEKLITESQSSNDSSQV